MILLRRFYNSILLKFTAIEILKMNSKAIEQMY